MAYIIPEILVTVAESADSDSISALRRTCKRFNDILSYHERSIVKANLQRYFHSAIDPRAFPTPGDAQTVPFQHPLLQLYGDNDGTVLTSDSPKRTIARPYSFAVIKELELRERRIQDLFGHHKFQTNPSFDGPNRKGLLDLRRTLRVNLTEAVLDLERMQRACRISDIIGDCAARIVARANWVEGYNAHLDGRHDLTGNLSHKHCRCNCWTSTLARPVGAALYNDLHDSHAGDDDDDDDAYAGPFSPYLISPTAPVANWPLPPPLTAGRGPNRNLNVVLTRLAHVVRAAQADLVRRLPVWDLVGLARLSERAGDAHGARCTETWVAFQESALRRGFSLSLWALATTTGGRPWGGLRGQAECAVDTVQWEIFLWETGYGRLRVRPALAFEPVGDPGLAMIARGFGPVEGVDADADAGRERGKGKKGEKSRTIPVMQRSLISTLVKTLCEKDLKGLTKADRQFVASLRPAKVSSG